METTNIVKKHTMLYVGYSFNLRHLVLTPDPREYYTDCSVADAAGQALGR